ncbi:Uncharacterized protein APZ42_009300, partial [Daphnia magna]
KVDVDDLDAIRSDVEKRKTFHKEPYKTIYSLAEQAFVNFYWTREWESYYDFLKEIKESQNRPNESQLNELQKVVERLKAALMWTHSGKSYKEMMEVCTKLKEKLDPSGWKDKFSAAWEKLKRSSDEKETPWVKCINWAREQERNIVGFFEDSHKDLQETNSKDFMSFVFRLKTDFTDMIRQPSKSDEESMVPQFRKALHYLDHNKEVPFTVSEMKLFNEVFSKTNE